MKKCAYCGRENQDAAARCQECGTELVAPLPRSEPPPRWDRIITLDHEVEAERLTSELDGRAIPHLMVSHADSAFDGIFQTSRGWGHVEAPIEHRETILTILNDIRQACPEPETPSAEEEGPDPTASL